MNTKLREMEALETELGNRPIRGAVVSKLLCRSSSSVGHARPSARELVETREELLQVLLYLHLRE